MKQISTEELGADLNTIFDRINRNHEIFSVMREKNQAVVILDAGDYRRLTEHIRFEFRERTSQVGKARETIFPDNMNASEALILSALHTGKISESYRLMRKWETTEKKHPMSEAAGKATEIMRKYHLTDRDIGQAFRILSDLLGERKICIRSADFSIKTYRGDEWIHYNYHLELAKPELLPELETELNVRLSSSLTPELFEALEIDISAEGEEQLCMAEDISKVIASDNRLMQGLNEARQGMRERIPGLSYEDIFGE